jgi:hypothetical protein
LSRILKPATFPRIFPDYEEASAHFFWETAAGCLDGMPDGALNIAHETIDRHVGDARAGTVCAAISTAAVPRIWWERLISLAKGSANK